ITTEEIMDVLYDALETSEIIKNAVVCFDGFTGFTPSQNKVLERILVMAKEVYVTVTIDEREDIYREGEEFQLFHLSKKTIGKLIHLAQKNKIEILEPIYSKSKNGTPWRFEKAEALRALERNLFRHPYNIYQKPQEEIAIKECKSPKEEVLFVVGNIRRLVRTEGYRYRDFAVVSGDIESYGRLIEKEFKQAQLPYFLDSKKEIIENPFVIWMNSLFEMAERRMDYESMFHYLRCGMLSFKNEELDYLENYCLAMGIRGVETWKNPFYKSYGAMTEDDLVFLNQIRERVMVQLESAEIILERKDGQVKEYILSLYNFIIKNKAFEQLQVYEAKFKEQENYLLEKEYGQVYKMVMELLERMMELLGEEKTSRKEFRDILNAGLKKLKVGMIPSSIDQIIVGDMERTRLKNIKVLFFIGVNDGVVPKAVTGGGILSDMERELLKNQKVELAPTKREQIYTERFYLYLNLTKPNTRVWVTYCLVGLDGKAVKPSFLIGKIEQLFPDAFKEKKGDSLEELEMQIEEDRGEQRLIHGLRNFEGEESEDLIWEKIYSLYYNDEKLNQKLINEINLIWKNQGKDVLGKEVSKALYGGELKGSVTRLEQYAACAYAHFLNYGLRLQERQEFKINIPDMGNIFHKALERYERKMQEQNLTWKTVPEEEQKKMAGECVKEVTKEYGNAILHSSKRNEYVIERIERILNRTLWALTKQISSGDFEPKGYELSFSFLDDLESVRLPLADGNQMQLMGRVDRIDLCEKEQEIYVKVLDYKTGKKSFDITDVYYGLQLQLVVYMETMLEKTKKDRREKTVVPAGIFYYNIDDPIVDKPDAVFLEEQILKELRVNGLVNEKTEIIRALDHSFDEKEESILSPSIKSNVIPVETVKCGELSKNSSAIKTEDFQRMISFVRKKMTDFGNEIMEGNYRKNPYKLGDATACDYCKFAGACGFDKKLPQNTYRILQKLKSEEAWEKIEKNGGGTNEVDQRPKEGN
ncbi:MAG: PD-(D/E)XK nuclease family protein, partial [Acetivibrio sp.]